MRACEIARGKRCARCAYVWMLWIVMLMLLIVDVALLLHLKTCKLAADADEVEAVQQSEEIESAADVAVYLNAAEIAADVSEPVIEDDAAEAERTPLLYTDADAEALARMAWGESRGVEPLTVNGCTVSRKCQQAAAMWCALNRYDAGFEDSIAAVVAAPRQFHGYAADHPLDDELLALAHDVLERWERERLHGGEVGRVLPAEYLFFVGDGENNHFAAEWRSGIYYAWTLPDVYEEG